MEKQPRWVYVYEEHVIGIGMPVMYSWVRDPVRNCNTRKEGYAGEWDIIVLPDWMSRAFLNRLTTAAIGDSDPIHYVTLHVPETMLIMGEGIETFEIVDNSQPTYFEDFNSPIWRSLPPSPEEHLMNTRILLDGVLIWGREEYPGERKLVIPRVKIPRKLREGIPALESGEL